MFDVACMFVCMLMIDFDVDLISVNNVTSENMFAMQCLLCWIGKVG